MVNRLTPSNITHLCEMLSVISWLQDSRSCYTWHRHCWLHSPQCTSLEAKVPELLIHTLTHLRTLYRFILFQSVAADHYWSWLFFTLCEFTGFGFSLFHVFLSTHIAMIGILSILSLPCLFCIVWTDRLTWISLTLYTASWFCTSACV